MDIMCFNFKVKDVAPKCLNIDRESGVCLGLMGRLSCWERNLATSQAALCSNVGPICKRTVFTFPPRRCAHQFTGRDGDKVEKLKQSLNTLLSIRVVW